MWLLCWSAAEVRGQTALHDLFERVGEQAAAAAGEHGDGGAGPFIDDPLPAASGAADPGRREAEPPALSTGGTHRIEGRLPLAGDAAGDVKLSQGNNGLISLVVRDASLSKVLALLAQTQDLNIVAANDIDALISITLHDVPLEEALTAILSVANYTWVQRNNIILVTSLTDGTNLSPDVQGRQIQVFELDYASSLVVSEAVTNFLSPIGKVTTTQSDPTDNRKTREMVIVEDLPESLARIAAYISQVDCPPRQVLIEAHVLQVNLEDETRCGVDFHALFRIAGAHANIVSAPSLASPLPEGPGLPPVTPSVPALLATFAGSDFQAVVEALQDTSDSKTLGSPKLLVLDGQLARIQVGETLYYSQVTTTETTTQQGAGSVETGVILELTPRISRDGRILLRVQPEVSSPSGTQRPPSPDGGSLPPDIARIELQSDVMLRDGEGMIIGGLINEVDSTSQQKVPYLGEVKGIGWLFRRTTITKDRQEIIFALLPRILPYNAQYQAYEQGELVKAGVPLFDGPLCRTERPWDPILPDGKRVYRPLVPRKPVYQGPGPNSAYVIPPTPLPQQHFYGEPCGPSPPPGVVGPFLSDEALPVPPEEPLPARNPTEIVTDRGVGE
jgi:type II secretory pathway component GspD/PulD (secretin)